MPGREGIDDQVARGDLTMVHKKVPCPARVKQFPPCQKERWRTISLLRRKRKEKAMHALLRLHFESQHDDAPRKKYREAPNSGAGIFGNGERGKKRTSLFYAGGGSGWGGLFFGGGGEGGGIVVGFFLFGKKKRRSRRLVRDTEKEFFLHGKGTGMPQIRVPSRRKRAGHGPMIKRVRT